MKTNEVVVVTGASAGVGRATVREFARRGARIGLVARGIDRLRETAEEVERLGGTPLVCATDVADAEGVELAAQEVEESFGPIDIWINDAMTSVFSPVKEMRPSEYERVTSVTFLGAVYGTLAALKRMLPRDRGHIVQVGSALAYRSIPLQSAYCAAKHALLGFTDSLRSELIHDRSNVELTMVQLPAMNTPQFSWVRSRLPFQAQPVPPIFQPEVAARAIHWAAHHHRRELFVGGSTLEAIVGQRFIAGWLDRYLAKTGYKSQQTQERRPPDAPDNLWRPVPLHVAAHGKFDQRASDSSAETWLSEHRLWLWAIAAGLLSLPLLRPTRGLCRKAR